MWHMGVAYGCGIWVWHMGVAYGCGIWVWHMGVAYGCGIWVWHMGVAGVRTHLAACIPSQVEASLMRTLSLEIPASS